MFTKTKNYDVVIIGAGPAGLMAAKYLAEQNKKVIVVEKNKKIGPKVCAGGLTIKDFDLGIDKNLVEFFYSKVKINFPGSEEYIEDDEPFIATVDREKLGKSMTKEAKKAGAKIVKNTEIIKIDDKSVFSKKQKFDFKHLIGADGSGSLLRKELGLGKKDRLVAFHYKVPGSFKEMEIFFDEKLFGSGYAWIFPHKNFTSIGCCEDPNRLVGSKELQKNFKKWTSSQPKLKNVDLNKSEYESWFINYDYQGHEFGNKYLVGDAAGFASGLTGEGMYFAMLSGLDVAKKIVDAKYKQEGIKEILKIKKKHETLLDALSINKKFTKIDYETISLIVKSRLFDKLLIKNFG